MDSIGSQTGNARGVPPSGLHAMTGDGARQAAPVGTARERLKTYAIARQKGGVGKTTLTVVLADALAAAGAKVVVADLGPQSNATRILGVDTAELPTLADLLLAEERNHSIQAGRRRSWPFLPPSSRAAGPPRLEHRVALSGGADHPAVARLTG